MMFLIHCSALILNRPWDTKTKVDNQKLAFGVKLPLESWQEDKKPTRFYPAVFQASSSA